MKRERSKDVFNIQSKSVVSVSDGVKFVILVYDELQIFVSGELVLQLYRRYT